MVVNNDFGKHWLRKAPYAYQIVLIIRYPFPSILQFTGIVICKIVKCPSTFEFCGSIATKCGKGLLRIGIILCDIKYIILPTQKKQKNRWNLVEVLYISCTGLSLDFIKDNLAIMTAHPFPRLFYPNMKIHTFHWSHTEKSTHAKPMLAKPHGLNVQLWYFHFPVWDT